MKNVFQKKTRVEKTRIMESFLMAFILILGCIMAVCNIIIKDSFWREVTCILSLIFCVVLLSINRTLKKHGSHNKEARKTRAIRIWETILIAIVLVFYCALIVFGFFFKDSFWSGITSVLIMFFLIFLFVIDTVDKYRSDNKKTDD